MKRIVKMVARLFINIAAIALVVGVVNAADRLDTAASDPLNATYLIEGKTVGLVDGRSELPAAPGSAMTVRTTVWKQPVYGDLDGDGDEDAALLLTHDPGGSGTFYYAAAAVRMDGRYQGTNAVLLGDRIEPKGIAIRNRTVVVNYVDHRPDEPFSATPSVYRTMAVVMQHGRLLEATSADDREKETRGWVTIGHEVRSFKPCVSQMDLWLMGQSPDLKAIMAAYRQAMPDPKHYRPVFMVLAGKQVELPTHGFGADYDGAFLASRLVRVTPGANCGNDSEDIDAVDGFMHKITFDLSTLDEDGLYGPIGAKRALSYEFCIPNTVVHRTEVERIDPTVAFFEQSPGRIGCASRDMLCIGSTHQSDYATVLQQLAELPYVQRIDESVFE